LRLDCSSYQFAAPVNNFQDILPYAKIRGSAADQEFLSGIAKLLPVSPDDCSGGQMIF